MKRLLLIDDDPDRAALTSAIFERFRGEIRFEITVQYSGEEAIELLRSEFKCWSQKLPHLILLDLHMTGMSGLEVLRFLKSHRRLKRIPVVIFSSSTDQDEIDRCYELFANTFIPKTSGAVHDLDMLAQYWMGVARLPQLE